jgi:hypothetical protein
MALDCTVMFIDRKVTFFPPTDADLRESEYVSSKNKSELL